MPEILDLSGLRDDPYPMFAEMRRRGPVLSVSAPLVGRAVGLPFYVDVVEALKDPRLANDPHRVTGAPRMFDHRWLPSMLRAFGRSLLFKDPPDHTRLRNMVHKTFTPRRMEALAPSVERIVTELLDEGERRGELDLLRDFALAVPLRVISEILGVPEEERLTFHRRTAAMMNSNFEPLKLVAAVPSGFLVDRFLQRLIRLRRDEPGDDLLSALVHVREGEDRLSSDELIAMVFLLLLAGHETTVNLIASGALALLDHPEELLRLRRDPSLVPSAIEELLRFTNPAQLSLPRYAREPIELHGVRIPTGSVVLPFIASANRDESVFADADRVDVGRSPNRHVAFGQGVHFCLGGPLARLEGRIALATLVQRFPDLRLAVPRESLRWGGSFALRGLRALPVRLRRQSAAGTPRA